MKSKLFPRRSLLYSPADQPDLLEKALNTTADTLIYDLEDSVSRAKKPLGRENIETMAGAIRSSEKEICVRINGLKTDYWLDDLEVALTAEVDSVKVPMVESVWELQLLSETIRNLDPEAPIEIGIALETPQGILSGSEIANFTRNNSKFTNVNFGNADYINAVGAPAPTESIADILRFFTVSYAKVGNMDPIGSALLEIDDAQRQHEIARRNREFGFIGMTAIHPHQVEIINDVFTPTTTEVEEAEKLVSAFESTDRDSIMVDGVFLDAPVVKRYRKILQRHEVIEESRN